jgi:BMFP domain-containing protein YqiC
MERVSRTAKLAEQLLRDRERRRDAVEARPDTECLKGARSDRPCGRSKPSPFLRQRLKSNPRPAMTQTTNRFFDEMARLMNDAAGVASGVRSEFDTMVRNQAERILRDLDVVMREEFEAVKEMARIAREENEALKAHVAALEAKLGSGSNP